jgi:hypothetical protein
MPHAIEQISRLHHIAGLSQMELRPCSRSGALVESPFSHADMRHRIGRDRQTSDS